jgi:diadenosine tetraphosphatase ApaH/serine/threonine PP2A family protein phosphatase
MKIAILSDVHANLAALEAVLRDVSKSGAQEMYCLGDTVGYGCDAMACVELLQPLVRGMVLGNHDSLALGYERPELFTGPAREAIARNCEELLPGHMDWLRSAPYLLRVHNCILAHASTRSPADWPYVFEGPEVLSLFRSFEERIALIGHTHCPFVAVAGDGPLRFPKESRVQLYPNERAIVNCGSVGQPRDGDPRAAWLLMDPSEGWLELRRVEYDIALTQMRMRTAGYPERLWKRLAEGR